MTHAYNKCFLSDMMDNLGYAVDFAVNGCGFNSDSFYDFFITSQVASLIEQGNLPLITGCSGIELALTIFDRVGITQAQTKRRTSPLKISFSQIYKSPEFWAGWVLAFYQWSTNISFSVIRDYISFSKIITMYHPLHEAPKEKFVDVMNDIIKTKSKQKTTNLHNFRKIAGLTQKELALLSGVNLRTLQQYETGAKDINKASGSSINSLARALRCNFYDIMELDL